MGFDSSPEHTRGKIMFDAISAVLSGVLLVLLSMLGGGIIYFLLRDCVKRHIRHKDQEESS
ncbi:MAG: hypothetical protein KPEEDBHJ_00488 [Anaerolineales bacterium]|jgi:hypothetical protein|nr:hypothetical protein [Anaerolineales bacterium]